MFRSPLAFFIPLAAITLVAVPALQSQTPELVLSFQDSLTDSTGHRGELRVVMSNFADTILGFNLLVVIERPDLIRFDLEGDRGQESVLSRPVVFDTNGTLCSGWPMFIANSWSGTGAEVVVACATEGPFPDPPVPGIPPQQDGILFRLPYTIGPVPDTVSDCYVRVYVDHSNPNMFCFTNQNLECIGITPEGLDTGLVWIYEYEIPVCQVPPPVPGDFDCDGFTDIGDLVELVSYMFSGGPPSYCPWHLDTDSDWMITIADLIDIVNSMFGPEANLQPASQVE